MERLIDMVEPVNKWPNGQEHKVILTRNIEGVNVDLVEGSHKDNNCKNCFYTNGGCPEDGTKLACGVDSFNYFVESRQKEESVEPALNFTAPQMLKRASDLMVERAVQYDSPEGERSMEKITNAFNAITGKNITEPEGWMFMVLLKLVRDNNRTLGHQDSCEDLIAYSSLYGESRLSKETK